MSRKHFKLIAEAIAAIENQDRRREMAEIMANVCANDNPRFNYSIFYAACGVEG